jgi:hypothetical protein
MQDPTRVGCGEPFGDGETDLDGRAPRNGARRQALAKRLSVKKLRDGEIDIPFAAEIVDVKDVRVRESRDYLGFAFESRQCLGITGEMRGRTFVATSRPSRASSAR